MTLKNVKKVTVRVEKIVIPTYLPAPPERNPMFLENRVYQGSSGKVYPLPFTDRISEEKNDREWTAIYIENDFLEVMILPEIGGRIHAIYDKIRDYDLIYRQSVIKPALVGLAGSWISGGIEFNFAQHHRPATFLPVDYAIERTDDGGAIVWLGDHEPMTRMKSMHGVCLTPDRALVELKVRVYNRTPLPQTFLWWANAATRVHEGYQSFFPPDVHYVADHAKRATSTFPLCDGVYYGVDYGERARSGIPEDERPRRFVPPHISGESNGLPDYAPNDLSWYANIPVPTSYMCVGSKGDFFGGYDHYKKAGIVHVADHRFAPGKKQWTWGNHDFGYAWDRNLSDDEAPYIELMAGVFTDNQPDFSHLAPFETKQWSQFWYGIGEIGVPVAATEDVAMSVTFSDGDAVRIGICATREFPEAKIIVGDAEDFDEEREFTADLSPHGPFFLETTCSSGRLDVTVKTADGDNLLLFHEPHPYGPGEPPGAATEIPPPESIASVDELYLAGRHLEQYRHATRSPESYFREILGRDPSDWRANNAIGLHYLRRGEFSKARLAFERAVARLTARNSNPETGEAHYNLGLALRNDNGWSIHSGLFEKSNWNALDAFSKSAWNAAEAPAARFQMAANELASGNIREALANLDEALALGGRNLRARNLRTLGLFMLDRDREAREYLAATRRIDPLDNASRILDRESGVDVQTRLDVAHEFGDASFAEAFDAIGDLTDLRDYTDGLPTRELGAAPIALYTRAYFGRGVVAPDDVMAIRKTAAAASPDYCFPHRVEEIAVLEWALGEDPSDARAAYYLGCLFYDKRRYDEAIAMWERSALNDETFATVWRNLGIAYFNVSKDRDKALGAYENAFMASGESDARILYERDQFWKRIGESPLKRLAELERFPEHVRGRDDLSVEYGTLLNQSGRHQDALALLESRRFQPWEGGEGLTLGEYKRTRLALGHVSLRRGDAATARIHFESALNPPENLGEAFHLLANRSDVHYFLGVALDELGERDAAVKEWQRAAFFKGDFREMSVRSFSDMTYYSALSLRKLGNERDAVALFEQLRDFGIEEAKNADDKIDYFATSLPAMLLFDDDVAACRRTEAQFIEAQARFGLGDTESAKSLLGEILKRDPSHARAADFVAEM